MSEYYAAERSSSTISHIFGWGVKKGSQRENHKYIARIQEGDHYRYFYTQAEQIANNAAASGYSVRKIATTRSFQTGKQRMALLIGAYARTNVASTYYHVKRGR